MARHRALQMFGRSGNPAFKSKAFTEGSSDFSSSEPMTLSGTVNKTGLYLFLCFITAAWTWNQFYATGDPASIYIYIILGIVGGLIAALITIFKPTTAPISAPIYALLEGFAIGGVSAVVEASYPGIVIQAVGLTFGTFVCFPGGIEFNVNFLIYRVSPWGPRREITHRSPQILSLWGLGWPTFSKDSTSSPHPTA